MSTENAHNWLGNVQQGARGKTSAQNKGSCLVSSYKHKHGPELRIA